ncbi:hypothetical protein [Actinomadura sp. 6N118]|uniref:hypothetical protein n=1 Tax=Actinomadura sp. 6N118 TaxID=3375151 RepID=UPI00378F032C
MSETAAAWLPTAVRDAVSADEPRLLDALLGVVEEQRRLLEADIDRLYDDLFIESCADWAVPYIGALLGLPADAERREVAFAIALRRRKGTPAALEDFAFAVTGLTARVVEGWQVSVWAQRPDSPARPAALDLRSVAALGLGTPFERARRSVRPGGPWTPASVTAMVWPWTVRQLVNVEAAPLGTGRFALHPLGVPAPLYLRPREARIAGEGTDALSRTGDETDAPTRATYRVLQALARPGEITYGASLALSTRHPLAGADADDGADPPLLRVQVGGQTVPWTSMRFGSVPEIGPVPAPPTADQVLVDVNRGFLQLGSSLTGTVRCTWGRAVPGHIGALAATADVDAAARVVVDVDPAGRPGTVPTLADAFTRAEQLSAGLLAEDGLPGVPDVEIRLATSDRLTAPPAQTFTPRLPRWRIVAPPLLTPVIVGDLALDLPGACLSLEGFFLKGSLSAGARLAGLDLVGVTMDPAAGELRADPAAWELALSATRCVLAPIRADLSALPILLTDCVVDGRRRRLSVCGPATGGPQVDAVTAAARFGPALRADSVTFAGPVRVDALDAVDCLFADGVDVVQQQEGCVRHSYLGLALGPASQTAGPRHPAVYRCLTAPPPVFASDAFDAAGYFCLELEPDHPLLAAASDGGEVGAYHRTRRAARVRRLRQRVDEFTPLGLSAGVTVVSWEE